MHPHGKHLQYDWRGRLVLYLKMDLDKTGLDSVFKPYEIKSLQIIETLGEASSNQIWIPQKTEKSRASVINFCTAMAERGYLKVKYITGKGGHRGIYSIADGSLKKLQKRIGKDVVDHARRELLK